MDFEKFLELDPYEMIEVLTNEYVVTLPSKIETIDDMNGAEELLLKLTNNYAYLNSLAAYAKIKSRDAKRSMTKLEYEDYIDKKEIITRMVDVVKQQYNAISRAVTIKIENNREMNMK